jgi:hypothetical protein
VQAAPYFSQNACVAIVNILIKNKNKSVSEKSFFYSSWWCYATVYMRVSVRQSNHLKSFQSSEFRLVVPCESCRRNFEPRSCNLVQAIGT